ncbi:hypothetical protein GOODEAATRI_012695 [Goodea atripinnis]|uniref:Uncharacterized protein n=1 Tax=Goodea atripinnis TaxID=208336 RepID=A0ABV0MRM9_9TELE
MFPECRSHLLRLLRFLFLSVCHYKLNLLLRCPPAFLLMMTLNISVEGEICHNSRQAHKAQPPKPFGSPVTRVCSSSEGVLLRLDPNPPGNQEVGGPGRAGSRSSHSLDEWEFEASKRIQVHEEQRALVFLWRLVLGLKESKRFLLEGITSTLMQPKLRISGNSNKNSDRELVCGVLSVNICLKAGAKSLQLFAGSKAFW